MIPFGHFIDENFKPVHSPEQDLEFLANHINEPHEDYPVRVPATLSVMRLIEGRDIITKHDMMTIHSLVMNDLESRGSYRLINVKVGDWKPALPIYIEELMGDILPVSSKDDLETWYRRFQSIHPFEDGNGRVGGIIYYTLRNTHNGSDFRMTEDGMDFRVTELETADMMTALKNAIQHYPTEWEGDSSDVQNVIDSLSKSGYEIVKKVSKPKRKSKKSKGYKFTGQLSKGNEIVAKPSSNGDVRYIDVHDIEKHLPNHNIPKHSEVTLILEFTGKPKFVRLSHNSKYLRARDLKSLRKVG